MSYPTIDESKERPVNLADYTTQNLTLASWIWIHPSPTSPEQPSSPSNQASSLLSHGRSPRPSRDLLRPVRRWLDKIEVSRPEIAHLICRIIPAQCPFERDVTLLGHTLFHIPPMCKLNPVYDEVVGLRFRALCYLADVCGEDISHYC